MNQNQRFAQDRVNGGITQILEPPQDLKWPAWCCPIHRSPLSCTDVLTCPEGEVYNCKSNIPRFVPVSNYADAFGLQWQIYRRTQLDSYTKTSITQKRARRCLGNELWDNLQGKHVLECGCGAGRFTEILLDRGAYVTSVDLSEAVDANHSNFPVSLRHRIAQADILQLPFEPQQYDVVFCLGVIQHTPSPEKTIGALYDQLRPGGTLVIDHYRPSFSWYTKAAPLVRLYLRRLPPEQGIAWTVWLCDTLLPIHKMFRNFYLGQMLLSRLSPVTCYYHAFPDLTDQLHREWALLDTHDSLTDWYRHVRTRKQIMQIMEGLGMVDVWCTNGGNGIEARARRSWN